jgi:hypothetical protein
MSLFLPNGHFRPNLLLGNPQGHPQAEGLVHWFPVLGNARFASLTTNANAVEDVIGGRNGSNFDYLDPVTHASLPGTMLYHGTETVGVSCFAFTPKTSRFQTGVTLTAWVKLALHTPVIDTLTGWVWLQKDGIASSQYSHYPFSDGFAYLTTFRHARLGPITLQSSVNRADWHLVSITYDGITWKLYQNDILTWADVSGDGTVYTNSSSSGLATLHGCLDPDSAGFAIYLSGYSCDWRLYDHVLTQGEIATLYHPSTRWSLYYGAS